jgi:hypothetical protein
MPLINIAQRSPTRSLQHAVINSGYAAPQHAVQIRVQRYCFFLKYARVLKKKCKKERFFQLHTDFTDLTDSIFVRFFPSLLDSKFSKKLQTRKSLYNFMRLPWDSLAYFSHPASVFIPPA